MTREKTEKKMRQDKNTEDEEGELDAQRREEYRQEYDEHGAQVQHLTSAVTRGSNEEK